MKTITLAVNTYEDGREWITCFIVYCQSNMDGKVTPESFHLTEEDAEKYLTTCPQSKHENFFWEDNVMYIKCKGDK